MPDLPDYWTQAAMAWSEIAAIVGGLDAAKSAAPAVRDVYLATDTKKLYVCYTAGAWTDVTHACLLLAGGTMTGNIAMGGNKVTGLGAPTVANDAVRKAYADLFTLLTTFNDHSARHENDGADEISVAGLSGLLADNQHVINAEAKAAAVQAGAITNGVTKAPTHDAVYDVKVTADAALPAGDKYTDGEAVAAMGAKADDNPLHHDRAEEWGAAEHTAIGDAAPHHARYTDGEAGTAGVAAVEAAGLALASGKNIKIIQALTVDFTWSGLTAVMTAGIALILPQAVYVGADGKMEKALAAAAATMPAIALATGSISENAAGEFLLQGFIRDDLWDWTPGGLLYVSKSVGGALTQTLPAASGEQVQVVGVAITADIIYFSPSFELVEIS